MWGLEVGRRLFARCWPGLWSARRGRKRLKVWVDSCGRRGRRADGDSCGRAAPGGTDGVVGRAGGLENWIGCVGLCEGRLRRGQRLARFGREEVHLGQVVRQVHLR